VDDVCVTTHLQLLQHPDLRNLCAGMVSLQCTLSSTLLRPQAALTLRVTRNH
jgi:hypothetical protein